VSGALEPQPRIWRGASGGGQRLSVAALKPTRKSVKSILESGRDRPRAETEPLALEMPAHGNVRGPGYYH
jgi:hypothetical protein